MDIMQRVIDAVRAVFEVERVIKEVDEWDGSPSNYSSTEAYCDACLINVNAAAGNEDVDDWTQSLCKLPVREEGDASNVFVAQGVFAASGGRGISAVTKPADAPETSWNAGVRQAANQLIDAYEQMDRVAPANVWDAAGKEPPEEARALGSEDLYAQLHPLIQAINPMGYPWIHDVFHAEEGMSVVWSDGGILFSAPVNVDGDDIVSLGEVNQVKQEFVPVGRTIVRQQEDGAWRWFSRSAVSVLNRVGEIDSTALFDSFIAHAHETDEYPTRQFYHKGETFEVGRCDWLGREGNVLLTSGLYDDSELAQIEIKARQAAADEWGDSIRFEVIGDNALEILRIEGVAIPVYRNGRLIEISTVLERHAASWFTSGRIVMEGNMQPKEFEGLVELFQGDEDKARKWLEENAVALNRQIEEDGLVARTAEGEAPDGDAEPAQDIPIDDSVIEAITRAALESEAFTIQRDGLAAQVEAFEALTVRLDELTALITAQQATIDLLTQDDDAKRQRYTEDMPERPARAVYRPSVAHRATLDNGNEPQPNSAERMGKTLASKGVS